MLLLSQTNAIIQVTSTSSAAGVAVLNVHVSYVDETTSSTYSPVGANTPVAVSTPVTVVSSPAASTTRNIKFLSITNTDTVNATTVQVSHFDGAVTAQLTPPIPLPAGGTITYNDGLPWVVYGPGMTPGTVISDGLHGPVAVKPANTPAAAGDAAMTVALSPNTNPTAIIGRAPPGNDLTVLVSGTLTTSGSAVVQIGRNNMYTAITIAGVVSGAGASLSITTHECDPISGEIMTAPGNSSAMGPYTSTGHTNYVEVLSLSGAVLVTWTLSGSSPSFGGVDLWTVSKDNYSPFDGLGIPATGPAADGSAAIGAPVVVAGWDGTNVQRLRLLAIAGVQALLMGNAENQRATYSASAVVTVAASATDIVTIYGSASKTVRITRIEVYGTQTTAGNGSVLLIKRSAVDTGGTSTNPTKVPHDSSDAAATATVAQYTVNPTGLGAAIGTVRTGVLAVPAAATATESPEPLVWEFGTRNDKPMILRGVAQGVGVNLNGVTFLGGSFAVNVEWTEE